jgi:hypothetical protein
MVERMSAAPEIYFDRRVPVQLVDALAPLGHFHHLVEIARARKPLDLHLRALEGGAAHATLYLGLTRVLDLHIDDRERFWITGQRGSRPTSRFREVYDKLFDQAWNRPQSLDDLARTWEWGDGRRYIEEAIEVADPRYTDPSKEGFLQASLTDWPDQFSVIDRESVVGFRGGAKRRYLDDALSPIRRAVRSLARSGDPWTHTRVPPHAAQGPKTDAPTTGKPRRPKWFGDELDALAIDMQRRVLIIEAKGASDTGGVGWTPAQVAVYLRLFGAWVEARADDAPEVLSGMLDQRKRLGLAPEHAQEPVEPLALVPVIVIGGTVESSAKTANARMRKVKEALAQTGEPLDGLEVWQIDGANLVRVGLGGLR